MNVDNRGYCKYKTTTNMIDNSDIIKRIIENKKVKIIGHDEIFDDETQDLIKYIIEAINSNKLVPVICEDLYEYEDPNSHIRQSLQSYLVEQALNKCKNQIVELSEEELYDIVSEGYYGMRMLEKKLDGKTGINNPLYKIIYSSIMSDNSIAPGIHLKKEVVDFLNTCDFPLIITTNCFPIIKNELEASYDDYYTKNNTNSGSTNSESQKYQNKDEISSKCIYHIFGEGSIAHSNWGYSDLQILKHLRSAMGDAPWSNLVSAIENKSLFVIGNNTPDWLFRFILTPIFGPDVYNYNGYYINSDVRNKDRHLIYFLSDIHFSSSTQMESVLNELTKRVKKNKNLEVRIKGNRHGKDYDIFISYSKKDEKEVAGLKKLLENHGLKVYNDFGIKPGINYWVDIVTGLNNSAYFMPYITDSYLTKSLEYKHRNHVFEELRITENNVNLLLDTKNYDQMEKVDRLSKELSGVAAELILAEQVLKLSKKESYCIPIIQNNGWLKLDSIGDRVDNGVLPRRLFSTIQACFYTEDKQDPFDGKFDYESYKYLINE